MLAQIFTKSNGHQHLIWNGFNYGRIKQNLNGDMSWRCTAKAKNKRTRKNQMCTAMVRTKTINGYEMITSIKGDIHLEHVRKD